MKPIRLPEPPSPTMGVPEIFENGANSVIRRAVVIGNGFPGSENQSLGLVRSLGLYDKHVLFSDETRGGINEWLHWLPISLHKLLYYIIRRIYSYLRFITSRRRRLAPLPSEKGGSVGLSSILEADSKRIVNMARESYEKDGPLLVVASGRDTISVASSIKRLASEKVFLVQIQHPRSDLSRFDLVVTPNHDYYPLTPQAQEQVPRFLQRWITPREPPDEHVVLTVGALHQIDFAALRSAASTWHDEFAPLPKPLLVVNIGGPSCHCRYGMDLAKQLCTFLTNVLVSCGSVRISFSNRTPEKVSNMIIKELANNPKVYIWDGEEPNPYMGHLAWGDAFVVTADSVSMISEACSTGKPVYVIGSERCTWKLADFHKSLRERGVVRRFTGSEDISESWSYPPLNDTAEVARRIHEVLAERGLRVRP
ncbi:mitochondrial fission protein [Salix suchowensis]|nr:mitochondrial fission protein [Salix suchowensis]